MYTRLIRCGYILCGHIICGPLTYYIFRLISHWFNMLTNRINGFEHRNISDTNYSMFGFVRSRAIRIVLSNVIYQTGLSFRLLPFVVSFFVQWIKHDSMCVCAGADSWQTHGDIHIKCTHFSATVAQTKVPRQTESWQKVSQWSHKLNT